MEDRILSSQVHTLIGRCKCFGMNRGSLMGLLTLDGTSMGARWAIVCHLGNNFFGTFGIEFFTVTPESMNEWMNEDNLLNYTPEQTDWIDNWGRPLRFRVRHEARPTNLNGKIVVSRKFKHFCIKIISDKAFSDFPIFFAQIEFSVLIFNFC